MAGLVPAIHDFLPSELALSVIAGLDPAIHAMTLPHPGTAASPAGPLQLRQFF
jgi:hypothetical protein